MILVIKAKDLAHAFARMQVAGLRAESKDAEGNDLRAEYMMERCNTPPILGSDGKLYFAVLLENINSDKIPTNDSPNFSVLWREDEADEGGNQMPWPTVEVDCEPYDVAISWSETTGLPTAYETRTTRAQKIPRIV